MFLKGFEGWRHARQLQDELLDTLEAGVGADDVNLATLRGSWMVYWLAGWPQRPHRAEETCPGEGNRALPGPYYNLQTTRLQDYKLQDYKTTSYRTTRLQDYKLPNCKNT